MSAHSERKSFVVSVTLTELMFLLFFLLLLAAVYRLVHMERDLVAAKAALSSAEAKASALRERTEVAKAALSPSQVLSDEEFIELIRDAVVVSGGQERDRLGALKSRLAEMESIVSEKERAHAEASARAEQLERELSALKSKDPNSAVAGLAKCEDLTSNLRGQVANCQNRLGKGGMDHPPCWADRDTGRIEYLLDVTMADDGVSAAPAWPAHRASEALALPGIGALTEGKRDPQSFSSLGQPVLAWSNQQDPVCRHYVRILDRTSSVELHKRARFAIESVFYKYEVR
jgi:hypothetical protein